MKFEYNINEDLIKEEFFDEVIKTDKTEKMFDDEIQKIFTSAASNTIESIMVILNTEISKRLGALRQDIENEITIENNPDCRRLIDFLNRQIYGVDHIVFSIYEFDTFFNMRPPLSKEMTNVLTDMYWNFHFDDNGAFRFDRI
jgi:hypothetical protein